MRWVLAPAARTQPGDYAGSWVKRDKRLVVGVRGKVYPATHIAWFLAYGEWPDSPVKLEIDPDRDHYMTPLADLYLASEHYSPSPKAAAARRLRARQRERRRLNDLSTVRSNIHGVQWRDSAGQWMCVDPADSRRNYASFADKADAERYQRKLLATLKVMESLPNIIHPGDENIFADDGDLAKRKASTLTLADAKRLYYASPVSGLVANTVWPGAPLGVLHGNRLMQSYLGRLYSCASIVWFLSYGEWPRRKAITFRDGDPTNTRLDNLRHRDRPD